MRLTEEVIEEVTPSAVVTAGCWESWCCQLCNTSPLVLTEYCKVLRRENTKPAARRWPKPPTEVSNCDAVKRDLNDGFSIVYCDLRPCLLPWRLLGLGHAKLFGVQLVLNVRSIISTSHGFRATILLANGVVADAGVRYEAARCQQDGDHDDGTVETGDIQMRAGDDAHQRHGDEPATRATALFTAEATPACLLSISPSTAAVSGATVITKAQGEQQHARQQRCHIRHLCLHAQHKQKPGRADDGPQRHEQPGTVLACQRPKRRDSRNITMLVGSVARLACSAL